MCRKLICLVSFVLAFGLALSSNALAGAAQFDFPGDLSATFGGATLDYYNGARTSNTVSFGTASSFGLPALAGGDATVMRFPAFAPDQGLLLEPASSANGGGNYINQYTMIWDVLIPDVSANWMSLYNTSATNSNDGDFFIRQDGGIGISGQYHGKVNSGQWHRIAVVLDLVAGTMAKYIDGVHVGTQTASGVDGRWSMYTTAHGIKTYLLTDEDNETNSGYINSFCFINKALDASTIAGFGGPDADGVGISAFVKAENPNPSDGEKNVVTPLLQWTAGETAALHDVYFGTNPAPGEAEYKGRQTWTVYPLGALTPGVTYYWRIDEVEVDGITIHTGDIWSFTAAALIAYNPSPPDGAKYASIDTDLSWAKGITAITHDVYFGTDKTAVAGGTGGTFKGNQVTTSYKPAGLANDTTYYWRIDEVEADGTTKHPGAVWSFKTVPDIPITDPTLIGWWKFDEGFGTLTIDWSGHNNHGTLWGNPQGVAGYDGYAVYLDGDDYVTIDGVADDIQGNDITMSAWVKTTDTTESDWFSVNTADRDNVILFCIDSQVAVMYEGAFEGYGTTVVTDGEWHILTYVRKGNTGYIYVDGQLESTHEASFTLSKSDLWSLGQEWDSGGPSDFLTGAIDDARLYSRALTAEEVKQIMRGDPTLAWNPKPANRALTDIEGALPLTWSPGEKAAQHDVYFGADKTAVDDATTASTGIYRARQAAASYTLPEGLQWGGGPYYWRIDELNTDATTSKGKVWSFTVADYLIVDDFESYTDDVGSRIFQTWRDGWGFSEPAPGYPGNGSGSTVGYAQAPFAEQTIVNGVGQSMPFGYDNSGAAGKARYSETFREWASPQDWTRKAVKALTLWFRGYRGAVGGFRYDAGAGIYTMTAAGEDIWGNSDQFHYAFRRLSGVGSIQVKVLSISNTDPWAKGGVMIRDTLDPGSAHVMVVMTPGNGVALQYRGTAGGTSGNTNQSGITTPYWVKLERGLAGSFTAYHSSDGKAWTQLGQPVSIGMQSDVYIGLALTSNDPTLTCQAEFSDVANTGPVTGQWQSQDIGITSNDPEQLYVAVEDSSGKIAVVKHKDPNAVLLDTWQEWNVDLKAFSNAGVNLASVKKMYLGVGDRVNPKAGGTGSLYFDDIRLYRPRCVPSLAKPDADLSGNCVVDYADLDIMAGQWLQAIPPATALSADLNADKKVDLKDYAKLADSWLEEFLWP